MTLTIQCVSQELPIGVKTKVNLVFNNPGTAVLYKFHARVQHSPNLILLSDLTLQIPELKPGQSLPCDLEIRCASPGEIEIRLEKLTCLTGGIVKKFPDYSFKLTAVSLPAAASRMIQLNCTASSRLQQHQTGQLELIIHNEGNLDLEQGRLLFQANGLGAPEQIDVGRVDGHSRKPFLVPITPGQAGDIQCHLILCGSLAGAPCEVSAPFIFNVLPDPRAQITEIKDSVISGTGINVGATIVNATVQTTRSPATNTGDIGMISTPPNPDAGPATGVVCPHCKALVPPGRICDHCGRDLA